MTSRSISVSIDVFQMIWSLRRPDEQDEDAVLRRVLLSCMTASVAPLPAAASDTASLPGGSSTWPDEPAQVAGYRDPRHGLEFSHGFEIFRTYRGSEFRAVAEANGWRLAGSDRWFPSLNQLSRGIVGGPENAWENWSYHDDAGEIRRLTARRDPKRISSRGPSNDHDLPVSG